MKPEDAVQKLKNEFDENVNSHVFLVETNNETRCLMDIKDLIKHVIAKDDIVKKQIDDETYIELMILRADGKDIKKDQIMTLQDRLKTKPVLAEYMFYIIDRADQLNEIAANKLLKTIEEPSTNAIGFLITTNIDLILPTIKSRSEHVSMIYDDTVKEELSEDIIELASEIVMSIEKGKYTDFFKIKTNDKKMKDNHKTIANIIKDYYNTACHLIKRADLDIKTIQYIEDNNDYHSIVLKSKKINSILNKLTINMNGDLLLDKIYFELKEVK